MIQLQVGVKAFLKNTDGKYLLLQRNLEKYSNIQKKSSWDIPGGRIDPGTSLMENLKREVFEETGLTLDQPARIIASQDILMPDRHVVRLTFCSSIAGEPTLSAEHVAYKWVSIEELRAMDDLDKYISEILDLL